MLKKLSILFAAIFLFALTSCSNTSQLRPQNTEASKPAAASPSPSPSKKAYDVLPEEKFEAPFKKADQGVPVLMYHSIAYEKDNPVRLPAEKFEQQMKYLKDNGYHTLSLDQLYNYYEGKENIPEKSVVLTFDDGYQDNYDSMFPILKKYGFRGTIFIITSYVDHSNAYLNSEELKELSAYGMDIGSHTVNHEYLGKITKDKQITELKDSKAFLEKLLNKNIDYIAYPYGSYNSDTIQCAQEAGYKMAFTTDGRWAKKSNGILKLDRVYISGLFDNSVFIERITNPNYKFIN